MSNSPKKIHGSSTGFLWGRIVFTANKTACLRNVLLGANGVREGEIAEKYKVLGALNEARHEEALKLQGVKYDRELPVKYPVEGYPDILVSGRVDFVQHLDSGVVVEELKSTDSKYKLLDVIKKGHVVPENLAQIVGYMVALRTTVGHLIYTHYAQNLITGEYEMTADRAFEVLIDDAGRVCIDGSPSQFVVGDQIAHTRAAARVIAENEVWDRPHNWSAKFGSPCSRCPWSSVCDRYDDGEIKDAVSFIEEAKLTLKGVKND